MATVRARKRATAASERLLNRELSFIDYAGRLVALARDEATPLLERLFFLSVSAEMLDEFFMIRIAGLTGQAAAGVSRRLPDGRTPQQTLVEARERVFELYGTQTNLWSDELCPALAAEKIVISDVEELNPEEREELDGRFQREIFPVLTPLAVGPGQPFPYISALSISLGLFVADPDSGEARFARVKVPEGLPRFFPVGRRGRFVPLERVLAHYLPDLFPGMEILERSVFRVTRDGDLEVSDEADDLLEAVELELRRARFGEVTRLEVSESMSQAMRERLQQGLRVADELVYPLDGFLDLADLAELTKLDRPDLKNEPWLPVARPPWNSIESASEQFTAIRAGDLVVHHPYDSFASSFESYVNRAAADSEVIAIKSTVYRTSDDTPLVPALIDAAERGKQTVCLVEIKARGDERRNIEWSRALEQAGVHIVYGFPGLKIHAKMTLVVRREAGRLRRYVHLGTGNYNAVTARTYEDFGLFTADEEIADDIADLFNHLTGFGRPASFRKLLVAPYTLRERLLEEIRTVAEAATAGKKARIRIKVNGLTHPQVIDELYAASEAGARVDLLVRGVCSLRPGVPGLSEHIKVRSVLGRFLEHSRLFVFDAADRSVSFMGSADLMPRNLDHRVEVVTPIEDVALQAEVAATLEALWRDTASSFELDASGQWNRVQPKKDERPRSGQQVLMRRARRRLSLSRTH
ncbi:MAG TPA: polyphosphate kinase 1 [Gaiellaceae bacterium]|jgi:polyphosphate kinase|nr:polyphosphate kinase 1 [Gaiellaceae bacterium]